MPRKLFGPLEEPLIFQELMVAVEATLEEGETFDVKTDDPMYASFADAVIAEHYPPQTQLPID